MSAKIPAKPSAKIPPKPGKDTVYLDAEDDITSIIEKVEAAGAKVVALVLPKRAVTLQSIVNMRLLKRSADKASKSIVLITNDTALIPLAGAVKLHVAKNLQSSPTIPPPPTGLAKSSNVPAEVPEDINAEPDENPTKLDYHRSVGELATSHAGDEPEETIDLDDGDEEADGKKSKKAEKPAKVPKGSKIKVPNFDRFRVLVGLGILAIILLIVGLVFAINVLPKAIIAIKTESLPVSANLTLTTSDSAKTLDEAKGIIPAVLKTKQQTSSQQATATGQQNNGDKAIGTVSLSASCPTPLADINAGLGLGSNGLTFITTGKLHLANTGQVGSDGNWICRGDVSAKAQQGGAKYNLSSGSTFTAQGYPGISGQNTSAMTGGTDNITTVVSQADLDAAKGKISSADTDNFTKAYEKELTDAGNYVLTATLKPADPVVTSSPAVGQPATNVSVSIQITYTVLVVQKSDLTKALTTALNKQVNPKKQKISINNVLDGATVSVQNQSSATALTLSVGQSTTAVPILDVPTIQKQVGGQKSGDIRATIGGLPGVKSVDVKLSPFWVSSAPKKPAHIHVTLQQVKDNGK